eukprot:TRINITY_DN1835_c0_g1_i1.p1 TRINITY_DN1835_c0_g1~~TRINITY_DN1835_c0_g1_i1.p1  ORF type:complete len:506 (-),score=90.55 TRINITY_DN1835_c0_g1_i1:65-1582(-)
MVWRSVAATNLPAVRFSSSSSTAARAFASPCSHLFSSSSSRLSPTTSSLLHFHNHMQSSPRSAHFHSSPVAQKEPSSPSPAPELAPQSKSSQKAENKSSDGERPVLMIPGPIEFSESVLSALGEPSPSHVSPGFIETFGGAIAQLRHVVLAAPSAQPFVIAGSGTTGWDMAAANLLEPGDKAIVVNTGVFGDWLGECLETYGAEVTHLRAEIGDVTPLEELESALRSNKIKMVTLTHVDTSTGVLTNIKAYAALIRRISPDTLIFIDGVCATAGEETRMADWDLDVVLTASQKAVGAPPGLTIMVASERAMKSYAERKARVAAYYVSWGKWLPVMKAYEARTPLYFATPPVNLVKALRVGLDEILAVDENPQKAMEDRFRAHKNAANAVRKAVKALGLTVLPVRAELESNTITAIRFPSGVTGPQLLPKIKANGAEVAGGLHPKIRAEYFRIGHMGVSATEVGRGHLERTIAAVEGALRECGYTSFKSGDGVSTLQDALRLIPHD